MAVERRGAAIRIAGLRKEYLSARGHVLALGLDDAEARAFLNSEVAMKTAEHIAAYFEAGGTSSLLAGVGSADVHNRDARLLPLVSGGASVVASRFTSTRFLRTSTWIVRALPVLSDFLISVVCLRVSVILFLASRAPCAWRR